MKEITIPDYMIEGKKHQQHHGRSVHDWVLIGITAAALITLWISC